MRTYLLAYLFPILFFLPFSLMAQTPQGINYQAVARDNTGSLIANQNIDVRFTILQTGNPVFEEVHNIITNDYGLFTLIIGNGIVTNGDFSAIDWANGVHQLNVEMDAGAGFVNMGTSQLVSVPYSLLAQKVETIDLNLADINDVGNNSPSSGDVLKWNGTAWVPSDDANTTYNAGAGLNLSGTIFSNTGDLDGSDDITNSTAAGGDLSGTFPNPSVSGLNGNPISAVSPSVDDVLKWNGSSWVPSAVSSGSSVWSTGTGGRIYYNSGLVGIGTSTPDAGLEIDINGSLSEPQLLLHEAGNDYARLNFDNNNGSNYWTIAGYIASNNNNSRFNIWNGSSGDLMTLTGDGRLGLNVGISPKTSFHIGNDHRVLFGTDTLGSGDKLMFLPDLHAFRVGSVATGAASTYWNRDSIGLYSFASGLNTRAQGFGATAMGRDTEATNSYAFASGYFTNADGQYSTAMGFNTDALALGSTALGYSTDAEENYSTALGYFAEAQAIYSVSIGNGTQAQSYSSMAVGRYNVGGGSATAWNSSDPIFEIGIGTSNSNRANAITVRKDGNVGIGTTVPQAALQVNGQIRFQTVEYFEDGGTNEIAARGDIRPTSDNTYDLGTSALRWDDVYATNGIINTSDRRDKENIQDLNYGLKEIMQLRPVRFSWKKFPHQGEKIGLIAQEIQPVIKEVVKSFDYEASEEDETHLTRKELDRLGVYYSDLIPVLIKGMQEQQEMIDELKGLLKAQQKEIELLKNR